MEKDTENQETEEPEESEATEEPEVTESEIDTSSFETQESFSKGTARRGSSWNRSKIKEMIEKLREDTEAGQVRIIPMSFVYQNLRNNDKLLAWGAYYARRQILSVSEELGINMQVITVGAQPKSDVGNIEIKFL